MEDFQQTVNEQVEKQEVSKEVQNAEQETRREEQVVLNEEKETQNEDKETMEIPEQVEGVFHTERETVWQKENSWSPVPTASEIRREARTALMGNWKTSLSVMVVAASIVFLVNYLATPIMNWAMLPLQQAQKYGRLPGTEELATYTFTMLPVFIILTLVSGVQTLVSARISRKLATYETIDFSMIRLSMSDLFKSFRITWVVLWRAFYIPILWMYLVVIIDAILMATVKLPDVIFILILMGALVAFITMMFRRIFSYTPIYQMWAVDPTVSARELANRSKELMEGNRWRLFCLEASFFGWVYLSLIVNALFLTVLEGLTLTLAWNLFTLVWSYATLPLMIYISTSQAVFVRDLMARKGMSFGKKEGLVEEKTAE